MKKKKPLNVADGSDSASTLAKPANAAVSPPVKPAGENRTTTARQYRILQIIQQNPGLTAKEIARRACTSESSFHRDLRYLQYDLNVPIESCPHKRNGYTVTKPVLGFASMYLTSTELLSLLLANRSLAATQNRAFITHADGALDKLSTIVPDEVAEIWNKLDDVISFRSGAIEVLTDAQVALAVWDAVLASEELELRYWKLEAEKPTPRTLRPLHLLCMDSAWYLFAHNIHGTDSQPHLYLLSRMRDVQRTGRSFERPQNVDIRQKLAHSIGVFGGDPERLHLRLRGAAARWFGERLVHRSQEYIYHEDATAELTMDIAINPELERLVKSWIGLVEVVAPAKLRASVAEAARDGWELMREAVRSRAG